MTLADEGFVDLGDQRLEYRMIGPRPDRAPTLVMLHEGLGCVDLWNDFPDRLSEATGAGVFVYSRAGYGQSSAVKLPRPLSYMHDEARDTLPRLLDAIGFRRGLLVGHSDGASIAAIHSGSHQDHRVRGLVLIAPHFIVEDVTIASIAQFRRDYEGTDLRGKLARFHADADATARGWSDVWLKNDFRAWDISTELAYIRVPVLIVQGQDDHYGTMRQIEIAQDECYCPVEVAMLPGVKHAPHREAANRTLELTVEFANRLLHDHAEGEVEAMPHDSARKLANGATRIDFQTDPRRYRHWKLGVDGTIATLTMDVDEKGGLYEGYELKLNSYDLGVDIELADAFNRIRFEHPDVSVILLRSGKPRVFCAGANIRMLAGATHGDKVNFCKFTNETRNAFEDASEHSGIKTIAVVTGSCAGGGYELALAADHIILADDGSSTVSLPELPLLAVLPGTGGLTRVTDKRKVRRDHADVFCTTEEGIKGKRAADWKLVDEVVPNTKLEDVVGQRAKEISKGKSDAKGVALAPLKRTFSADGIDYECLSVKFDRAARLATITLRGPDAPPPANADAMIATGASFWPLRLARELEDAILDIRGNEQEIAAIVFKSEGDSANVIAYDDFLDANKGHWFAREIRLLWKRTLKRIDVTSRSLVALIEPGSCFAGTLAEIPLACDRSYMLIGQLNGGNGPPASITLHGANFGAYPMPNGLSRLASRFLGDDKALAAARGAIAKPLDAEAAEKLGLVTFAFDDIDWDDEIRIFLEERASFSADALTGMEANLRFGGPETMESKIFARLTAWQNWIFQRANAVGEEGALRRYGTGQKPVFDIKRV